MKRHLIRSRRILMTAVPNPPATVYRTWCNWETLDTRAIAESAHVHTADMCKRCMAAISEAPFPTYLVPSDGE